MRTPALFLTAIGVSACCHGASLIAVEFSGDLTPLQRQTFVDAATFWNSVLTGCDLPYDATGQVIAHGLTITASVPYIDGVNGVLGSAGWTLATYFDDNPYGLPTRALYYATTGVMRFDYADVESMIATNLFYGVVLHEMAHVLGFGTLWTHNSNLNSTTYPLYASGSGQYFGPNALAQWQAEFNRPGDTYVPVELGGGSGTANGHWNERDGGIGDTGITSSLTGMDLANELMTGWASNSFYLSNTTLGALDDLGYAVDYSKAGIIDHVVVVPEPSVLAIALLAAAFHRRNRRG